jgi:hypothetical protein
VRALNNKCPKCGKKISPFYLKQNCPHCNIDLLYYRLEERLEADVAEAARQEEKLRRFTDMIKSSSVASPLLIIRLVLFFTPLGWMCLPMYNGLTLIGIITGLIKGELDTAQNLLPILSMGLVIVLSLAVIISSLFSASKRGLARNLIFSLVNTAVFISLGLIIGGTGVGWYITFAVYVLEIILHFLCDRAISSKKRAEKSEASI